MSTFEDERKISSKSPIDEMTREGRLSAYNRPLTAKRSDFDNQKVQKKLIIRYTTGIKQKKPVKDRNSPMLSKLKPTKISIEKERLYIENMELKVLNNELKGVIMKNKSKIAQLEKEIQRKEETNNSSNSNCNNYLVKLLKHNIKDLRSEIANKDQEIKKQRQNMKLSRFLEMELEVKAYMDECTRLKHYLEDFVKEKEENEEKVETNESNDSKIVNLLKIIDENGKEIQKLKEKLKNETTTKIVKTPKFQEEFIKVSKEIEITKKEFSIKEKKLMGELEKYKKLAAQKEKESSVHKLKLEDANNLIENLYKELKSLRNKNKSKISSPKILTVLNNILSTMKISLVDYLKNLNPENKPYIEIKTIISSIKLYDSSVIDSDIDQIIDYIKDESALTISIKKLIDYFNTFDFSLDSIAKKPSKTSELFDHLSLRMQLHRIPKENLIEALIGAGVSSTKTIHSQEIVLLLTNAPFNFSRKQATIIVDYLFKSEKTQPYSVFIDNFYSNLAD